ncbi:hypothetical protein LSL4_gp163c [Pseudomonas phage LSL4]|nr:hypothetical protein LSL4_gp163c [Pseudomonas phage LSL4]
MEGRGLKYEAYIMYEGGEAWMCTGSIEVFSKRLQRGYRLY